MIERKICFAWLLANGFKYLYKGDHELFYNEYCTVKFRAMFPDVEITPVIGDVQEYEQTNVFWLLGVLTHFNLIQSEWKTVYSICSNKEKCEKTICEFNCKEFKNDM